MTGLAGKDGVNILVVKEEFPSNAECQAGGKRMLAIPDLNRNQIPDANEKAAGSSITSCNIVNQLVRTVNLAAGSSECAAGGVKVLAGSDLNGNGALDESNPAENATIQASVICNGVAGKDGVDGVAGRDGKDGKDGVDGVTTTLPMASLVTTLPQESVPDSCRYGNWGGNGQFSPWILAMGPDSNRNGTLDEVEQPGAQFTLFCSGATFPVSYRDIHPTAAQFVTTATVTGNSLGTFPPLAIVEIKIVKGPESVQLADVLILRKSGEWTQNLGVGLPQELSAPEFTFRDSVSVNGTFSYEVVLRTPAARVQREATVSVSSLPGNVPCQPANLDLASRLLDNSEAIKSGGVSMMAPLELPAVSTDSNTHSILHIFKNGQRTESKEYHDALPGIKQSLDAGESFCALVTAPSTKAIILPSGVHGTPSDVRHEISTERLAGSTGMHFTLGHPGPESVGSILCFNGAGGQANSQFATVGDFQNAFGQALQICAAAADPVQPPAVDVVFVVDRGVSAGDMLRHVRARVRPFLDGLKSSVLPEFNAPIADLKIALVSSGVEIDLRQYSSDDAGVLDEFFTVLQSRTGWVNTEGGETLSIRTALDHLKSRQRDSVKVIILITDNGKLEDLDIPYFQGVFSEATMKRFMLFSQRIDGGSFFDGSDMIHRYVENFTARALRNYYKENFGVPNAYVGEEFDVNSLNIVALQIVDNIKKTSP